MKNFALEEMSVWETLGASAEPIIMYGTGNGADKVFSALEKYNIRVSGVTASNGFVRERCFHGFKVTPLSEFEKLYERFTVIVVFGSQRPEVIENVKSIMKRHRVLVPCVPVVGDELFSRSFIEKNSEKIDLVYEMLEDEQSKKVFSSYVNFEFSGKPEYLFNMETDESEAIESCLELSSNEVYVDIGAYRGDTVEKFLEITGGKYDYITACEPDKKSFAKLTEACSTLENFSAVNAACTGSDGYVGFLSLAGRQSSLGDGEKIKSVSLLALSEKHIPTYIKIDAEGSESEIISGGKKLLSQKMPKLNIAVYHKSADIFEIPLLIRSVSENYKIYLRHFSYIPAWDTLCFCAPKNK